MSVTRIGDWEGVQRLINGIDKEMRTAALKCLRLWCLKAEGLAKKHISAQDMSWKPLNPDYLADKVREGWSENIYVRTSDYFQAITSWVDGDSFVKKNMVGYAGVKKAIYNSEGHLISDIARIMEYGSSAHNIPARPLWTPVYKEVGVWIGGNPMVQPDKVFLEAVRKYRK